MDIYEAAVEQYLTRNGVAFVCPQYDLGCSEREARSGHWNLDFVVLDLQHGEILIAEVSAGNGDSVVRKALTRFALQDRLREALRSQVGMGDRTGAIQAWIDRAQIRFLGFVRASEVARCYRAIDHPRADDVRLIALEAIIPTYKDGLWQSRGANFPCWKGHRLPDRASDAAQTGELPAPIATVPDAPPA